MTRPTLTSYRLCVPPGTLPSAAGQAFSGIVRGHPTHPDGAAIVTASVDWAGVDGRTVPTVSGRVYELAEADPEWVATLRRPFDPDNPLDQLGPPTVTP